MKMRVWWIPQVPGKMFFTPVSSLPMGVYIMNLLASYDLFQFENNIKPDYANTGGIEVWNEDDGEWESWCDEETGEDDPELHCLNNDISFAFDGSDE